MKACLHLMISRPFGNEILQCDEEAELLEYIRPELESEETHVTIHLHGLILDLIYKSAGFRARVRLVVGMTQLEPGQLLAEMCVEVPRDSVQFGLLLLHEVL